MPTPTPRAPSPSLSESLGLVAEGVVAAVLTAYFGGDAARALARDPAWSAAWPSTFGEGHAAGAPPRERGR